MINADFKKTQETTPLILIVDDEETQQLFRRRVREKEGYRIAEASKGKQTHQIQRIQRSVEQ